MEKRRFGKTGVDVTVLNIGGCGLGLISQAEADQAIDLAWNQYGLNMIDVAPSYGKAEERLHDLVSNHRDEFFLAEKTEKRTKEEAWKELNQSLKNLGTDHFDLYQFHAVRNFEELNTILGKSGAMEAFLEAKESDIIKYIGITGHDNIQVFVEALDRFEFDTVLAPVTLAAMTDLHPANDFHPLLEKARKRNVGIQAIKSIMKRRWKGEHTYKTWYEPLTDEEKIKRSIWYTLSQNGVTTCPMACDVRLWPMILDAGENFRQLSTSEMREYEEGAKKIDMAPLFPYQE